MEGEWAKLCNFPFTVDVNIEESCEIRDLVKVVEEKRYVWLVSRDFLEKKKKFLVYEIGVLEGLFKKGKSVLYLDYFADLRSLWVEDETFLDRARRVEVLGIGNFHVGREDDWFPLISQRFDEGKIVVIGSFDKLLVRNPLAFLLDQFELIDLDDLDLGNSC